jgi:hypothetical protein
MGSRRSLISRVHKREGLFSEARLLKDTKQVSILCFCSRTSNKISTLALAQILQTLTLVLSCEQAKREGLKYVWVDTCCIDKTSSAELSESINSMFEWYRLSSVCYAYLDDVPSSDAIREQSSKFSKSLWFTRGWTLQELIAPSKVHFYGSGWTKIGEKHDLIDVLERITGITRDVLRGGPLSNVSIGMRMSWMARRKTTRKEDTAYCLMGIFNVNMPMLYGEGGTKAFIRLQEEIMKESDDQTLFAWCATAESEKDRPYRGILAASPEEFTGFKRITPFPIINAGVQQIPLAVTNRGIRIHSQVHEVDDGSEGALLALNCKQDDDFTQVVAIRIRSQGGDQYFRMNPSRLFLCPSFGNESSIYMLKWLASSSIPETWGISRQSGFIIMSIPDGVQVARQDPPEAKFDPKDLVLELGTWEHGSAILILAVRCSESLVLLELGATSAGEHFFRACARPKNADLKENLRHGRKFTHGGSQIVPLARGLPGLKFTGTRQRVQGFDMFCISITEEKEFGQMFVSKRELNTHM